MFWSQPLLAKTGFPLDVERNANVVLCHGAARWEICLGLKGCFSSLVLLQGGALAGAQDVLK